MAVAGHGLNGDGMFKGVCRSLPYTQLYMMFGNPPSRYKLRLHVNKVTSLMLNQIGHQGSLNNHTWCNLSISTWYFLSGTWPKFNIRFQAQLDIPPTPSAKSSRWAKIITMYAQHMLAASAPYIPNQMTSTLPGEIDTGRPSNRCYTFLHFPDNVKPP